MTFLRLFFFSRTPVENLANFWNYEEQNSATSQMLTCEKNYISFNFPTKFLLKLIKLNVIKKLPGYVNLNSEHMVNAA